MELKKTLLMPRTDFEMRGNLPTKEPLILARWDEIDLYNKMLEKNKNNEAYILHDGPPYANGNMHCGHMLNRLLKDFIVRYKSMQGYYTPFIPGWDTHGLPIENVITKKGINRKTTPIHEFRQKCEEFAKQQVNLQMGQVKRLGVQADFAHRYVTLDKFYEAEQLEVFKTMALKGFIFKGLKPVYWSPSSESALAEAEIEYADVSSYAIYVAFKVVDGKGVLDDDVSFVIWTTTPWTIPANLAISVNPDMEYGLYKTEKGKFVFLKELASNIQKELELEEFTLLNEFMGKEFEYIETKHPLYDRTSPIILGDHVTSDAGTGAVHTAPGHGDDDFIVGKKYNLGLLCPVDSKGYMTSEAGEELEGLFYEVANEKVLEMLEREHALLKVTKIVHSYPHDWRTKKPLIFRATPQWFCSIESIKNELLKEIAGVTWTPSWGELRMHNMIKDRGDWCISRQRAWGVPIPIIYNEDGTPIIEEDVFNHIISLVKEHGSNIWFEREAKELLPEGYKNEHSPKGEFKKETDIMDVWFDSGSSIASVIRARGIGEQADLYLEGSDQYRGWFNSSLIISTACFNKAPYKQVLTHGFIQDDNGDKMSKSKGNGIDPIKVINVYGADVMRLWAASIDYQSDVRIGDNILKQVSESYRKIRNTFKFLLGNLSNGEGVRPFDINEDAVEEYSSVDNYILAKLEAVKNEVIEEMDAFDFAGAISAITTFMSFDLSSFYLDITKDILYCEAKNSLRRLQVQNVIYQCVTTLCLLLTPILPFTMEEVYKNLNGSELSSQLEEYPSISYRYETRLLDEYEQILIIRRDVLKALEIARNNGVIGSAQEADVTVRFHEEEHEELLKSLPVVERQRLFIVSSLTISEDKQDSDYELCEVSAKKSDGEKCDRCWNYVEETIEVDGTHICERCKKALGE